MYAYVGAYTGPGRAEGIDVFRVDTASGALSHIQTLAGVDNPSFLALHPERPLLYAANETSETASGPGPGVSAFSIDPASGRLTPLNRQPAHGTSPCYVSLDPSGRYVLVANYGDGSLAVFPLEADGRLGAATDVVRHAGSGPNARRQQGPHAHSVRPDPDGGFILACDLGIDKVLVYRLDAATGRLQPNDPPHAATPPGGGPRHLDFHPGRRFLYVNNEISSSVTAFAYDPSRGALQTIETVPTLPADYAGDNSTAQILVHPQGMAVYVSNRGHDSIAVFGVDQSSGRLTPRGHVSTEGRTPRNVNLDPTGRFLYAANQNTHTIVVFRVDQTTGDLQPTGMVTESKAPVCVVFRQE
jgi:6-phosphogluconolactonase